MKNNPNDVTSLLTELMQRISDEDLTDEKLEMEIERGKAVADISKNVLAMPKGKKFTRTDFYLITL